MYGSGVLPRGLLAGCHGLRLPLNNCRNRVPHLAAAFVHVAIWEGNQLGVATKLKPVKYYPVDADRKLTSF